MCLQDTHFIKDLEPYIETQWGYKCVFNSHTSNSRGVAVLFNNDFKLKLHKEKKDNNGNLLALDLSINEHRVTLINIYGPNTDSPEFFEAIRDILIDLDNLYFVICGDYNIALKPDIDTFNYTNINNPKAREKLLEIMEDMKLVHYFRILNPDSKCFTWRRKNPIRQARLDYFLTSENLGNIIHVDTIKVKPGYRSDHSTVILELKFNKFEKGKGLWKFSNQLLKDKKYVDLVKETIQQVKCQYANILYVEDNIKDISNATIDLTVSDSLFLETLLMEVRGKTISFASYKKKERNKLQNELEKEINTLENSAVTDPNLAQLEEKKRLLENLRKEKLQGTIIRSKALWVDEGEKPTKYFCNLESRNYVNKTIQKLELEGKGIITNQKEILSEVQHFYQNLYKKNDNILDLNLDEILQPYNVPKLDEPAAELLEGPIKDTEILEVLKKHEKQ